MPETDKDPRRFIHTKGNRTTAKTCLQDLYQGQYMWESGHVGDAVPLRQTGAQQMRCSSLGY